MNETFIAEEEQGLILKAWIWEGRTDNENLSRSG
jgi:hypothetical protein